MSEEDVTIDHIVQKITNNLNDAVDEKDLLAINSYVTFLSRLKETGVY